MQYSSATLPVILTGDRTTGPLHLGHYVGSLKNRVTLQTTHQQYLLLADAGAIIDVFYREVKQTRPEALTLPGLTQSRPAPRSLGGRVAASAFRR
jgi:tryptophanyl-tRNA synthetase